MSSSDYAGFWLRFVAFIIDSIVLSVFYLLLCKPLFDFLLPVRYEEFNELSFDYQISTITIWPMDSYFSYAEYALVITAIFYYSFMESSRYQASLGKLALELRVTNEEGERLDFGKALLRNAAKTISSFLFMIGYIMAGFTERKQALHDIIAHTLVVKK
jgi:uncharacterized RDD family membrane protein YckC